MGLTFQEVLTACKKSGKKFVDSEFPASDDSLYCIPTRPPKSWPKVTEWKRVSEFCANPQMFISGSEPGDVIQGVLGGIVLRWR